MIDFANYMHTYDFLHFVVNYVDLVTTEIVLRANNEDADECSDELASSQHYYLCQHY